jgi:hypothetical protein
MIIDITERLNTRKLSVLHDGCVDSDNALRGINEALRVLDEHMARVEYRFLYWSNDCNKRLQGVELEP